MALGSPAQLNACYFKRTPQRGVVLVELKLTLGSTAIASQTSSHPDIAATRTSAGLYAITYPPSVGFAYIRVKEIYSPLGTIIAGCTTAKTIASGTASFSTYSAAATVADGASGDIITLELELGSEE